MKKSIVCLCMCLGLLGLNSCADNDPVIMEGNYGSTLEIGKDYKISTFTLPHKGKLLDSGVKKLIIVLQKLDKNEVKRIELESEVIVEDELLLFSVKIPRSLELKDGKYKLWLKLLNQAKPLSRSFSVNFENEMLQAVTSQAYDYCFSKTLENNEDGTAENPYTINNQEDFGILLAALTSDSTYAQGCHFLQTADIIASNVSSVVDGIQYYGEAFAGIYDGGGHEIEYVYSGENWTKDDNVGLFTQLRDGAVVKNLVLNARITGGHSKVGGLAAEAIGKVTLQGIEVKGVIDAFEYVGGLIGYVKSCELIVENCILDMNVHAGSNYAGGVAGGAYDTYLKVYGLETKNVAIASNPTAFSVTAGEFVGGVVGRMSNASFQLENINLKHTVDGETSNVKVITADYGSAGGLFGESVEQNADCSLKNVSIQCPVRVVRKGKYCGGLIGYLKLDKSLTLQRCSNTSIVWGDEAVGGMIGKVSMETGASLSLDGLIKNHVCVNGALSSVKGRDSVGGFIGVIYSGTLLNIRNLEIATSVSGTINIGGLIGWVSADITVEASTLLDKDMLVEGSENVGGLFGQAGGFFLKGVSGNEVVYNNQIPEMSSFKNHYCGKVRGRENVGGIIGSKFSGEITGFTADCTVSALDNSSAKNIGGIVGDAGSIQVSSCVFKGRLNSGGGDSVGGIVGYYYSFQIHHRLGISNCLNYGEVIGGQATGGIIGYAELEGTEFAVQECVNAYRTEYGGITGSGNVGGIIGWADNYYFDDGFIIENCANYAVVTGTGAYDKTAVGGIAGRLYVDYGNILRSANHGEVKGSATYMAGIVAKYGQNVHGSYNYNGWVKECCNKGDITGSAKHVGGIVGFLEEGDPAGWAAGGASKVGAVFDCYNTASITDSDAGGIVGFAEAKSNVYRNLNSGKIANGKGAGVIADGDFGLFDNDPQCYGNYFIAGSAKDGGKTGTKMSFDNADNKSKFHEKWDFSKVWQINPGGLPTLRNCPFQHITFPEGEN